MPRKKIYRKSNSSERRKRRTSRKSQTANIKVAVIYNSKDIFMNESPFRQKSLLGMYEDFSRFMLNEGIETYYCNYRNYSTGKLRKAWKHNKAWNIAKDVTVDIVFDKFETDETTYSLKDKIHSRKTIINNPEFEKLTKDKLLVYRIFSELSPETTLADNAKKLLKKHGKIILKPRFGYGGYGISVIENKSQLKKRKRYIAQQLIESIKNKGGIFDLRTVIVDGKIVYAITRTISSGHITNISQGAVAEIVKVSPQIKKAVRKIDSKLRKYNPRVYTADFMIDNKNKAWLIELNSKPLLNPFYKHKKMKKEIRKFYSELAKVFKGA